MGLHSGDLKNMMDDVFEIDSYSSKMGDDKNIITLSFSLKEKAPADDLVNFIEKGYDFVLDADSPAGEQSDGMYRVFVELERNKDCHDNIYEILDGVQKLASLDKLRFRYYKNFRGKDATLENIIELVPSDPDDYGITIQENRLNNYKEFFNRSYLENVEMLDDILKITKKYADPINFQFVDFGKKADIIGQLDESFNIDSWAEIIFLTKYVGDYNICKYGENIVLENEDKALIVRRK